MVRAQIERLGDSHPVLRVLVLEDICRQKTHAVVLLEESSRFLRRLAAAHLELARRDEDHLHLHPTAQVYRKLLRRLFRLAESSPRHCEKHDTPNHKVSHNVPSQHGPGDAHAEPGRPTDPANWQEL